MTQNLNLVPNNPELADVLSFFKKQILLETNCLHVGTIQSFNSVNQTADVTINYPKTFLSLSSVGTTSTTTTSYPQLNGCPVFVLGGGNGAITLPISSGDECLVFFNDRDISNWWGTGSTSTSPNTPRLHGFADAMVLVGVNSLPNIWANYDDSAVTLRLGGNSLKIKSTSIVADLSTGVSLELDATGKLKITNLAGELITSLVNLFTTATTATLLGPQPLLLNSASLAVLESFES